MEYFSFFISFLFVFATYAYWKISSLYTKWKAMHEEKQKPNYI